LEVPTSSEAFQSRLVSQNGGRTLTDGTFSWAGEKRTALDAWAGLVTSIIEGRLAGNNVLTLAKMG
jgi:hypothetical protein